MCNVTFQTLILLMNTIVTKAKIQKNQNVDISNTYNVANMFQYVSTIQFFNFEETLPQFQYLIYSIQNKGTPNISSNIKIINISVIQYCKILS